MIKIVTIDITIDKELKEYVYCINIIADKQEDIIVLKDVIDDHEKDTNIHCLGLKLLNCRQHVTTDIQYTCTKGIIYVQAKQNKKSVQEDIQAIEQMIRNFIL